jgi:FtsP/CotA-like multicopper oxidase with cupredoxin domain
MNRKIIGTLLITLLVAIGVIVFLQSQWYKSGEMALPKGVKDGETSILEVSAQEKGDSPVKKFVLTTEEKQWQISEGKKVSAWTYNGTVPGEPLRVTEGDVV